MIKLAGFDVVAELSIDTSSDYVKARGSTRWLPGLLFGRQVHVVASAFVAGCQQLHAERVLRGFARRGGSHRGLVLELTDGTLEFAVGTIVSIQ
jgi:hypothetical protein